MHACTRETERQRQRQREKFIVGILSHKY
jgi:hypothetical protein